MPGLSRPMSAQELSDGTLRYLSLVAALLTARPPELLVLNEPETSLHGSLIAPLARLVVQAAECSQVVVTTHSNELAHALAESPASQQSCCDATTAPPSSMTEVHHPRAGDAAPSDRSGSDDVEQARGPVRPIPIRRAPSTRSRRRDRLAACLRPPRSRAFTTTLEALPKGKARVPVPFDPNELWGTKREHHIGGTIAGMPVRGTIVRDASGWSFSLGPAWLRDCPVGPGHRVEVIIIPEGPQRSDLAPDLAAALEANPTAGEFFDTLAQFYRKGYLRWIDATKRKPELRAERITEVVRLLNEGTKERPAAL